MSKVYFGSPIPGWLDECIAFPPMKTSNFCPTRRARGRLDSHRQMGIFRGFVFLPFRERVSSLQPPVSRKERAGLSRQSAPGLTRAVSGQPVIENEK